MGKKKIVVRVPLGNDKNQRKAMKLASAVPSVSSVSIDRDKGQLTVTGENVDGVALTTMLKDGPDSKLHQVLGCMFPCMCPSEAGMGPDVRLDIMEDVKEEKKDDKKDEKKCEYPYYCGKPPVYMVEVPECGGSSGCTIC